MIRRGEWNQRIPNRFGAIAGLTGGKVGILGLGAIGLEFAKRIKGFDVEIGYCNRSRRSDVDFQYFPDVMELATWCDYLIVCLRSDASNRHIINADVLKALGPRGHVVNISRGWAVDEAALAHALRNDIIEGAALDVFDEEPYTGTELLDLDNLVMTPHFGGGTRARPAPHDRPRLPQPRQPFRRQAGRHRRCPSSASGPIRAAEAPKPALVRRVLADDDAAGPCISAACRTRRRNRRARPTDSAAAR